MSEKKQKRQRRDDVDSNHSGGNGNNEEVNNGNEEEDMRTSFENHHLYENPGKSKSTFGIISFFFHTIMSHLISHLPSFLLEYLSYVMNQTLHNRDEKRIKKIQQRFALNLLQNAQENSWEDHELARLFLLISNTINFSNKKRLKFLKKTQLYSTEFLACLGDEGIHLSTQDIISILQSNARNVNELIKILDQNLEHGVIDISNKEFLDFVSNIL